MEKAYIETVLLLLEAMSAIFHKLLFTIKGATAIDLFMAEADSALSLFRSQQHVRNAVNGAEGASLAVNTWNEKRSVCRCFMPAIHGARSNLRGCIPMGRWGRAVLALGGQSAAPGRGSLGDRASR